MGKQAHTQSYGFSRDMNVYLKHVIEHDNERKDQSGKWLEKITDGARSYDYWGKLVKDSRAMTTNDIQVLASTFGVTPYEWVANARRHSAGERVMKLQPVAATPTVGPLIDDSYEQQPNGETFAPPKRKAAKKGTLKADR